MKSLLSRGLVVAPVLSMMLAGVAPAQAAEHASVPAAHVRECAGNGLADAASMTQVALTSTKESSRGHTSRARAWVYGVAGATSRCVVVQTKGATVRTKRSQSVQSSVGYTVARSGRGVLDTGEVLPLNHESFSYGGSTGDESLTAEVVELVETVSIPDDVSGSYPPSLAGLAGHDVTVTLSTLEVRLFSSAWTTTELSRGLTQAQRATKLAAEVKVAKRRYAERVAVARAARDEQLALAAATTGLPAAWLTFVAEGELATTMSQARLALKSSKRIARQNAAQAGKGSDTRETFAHELRLDVALS